MLTTNGQGLSGEEPHSVKISTALTYCLLGSKVQCLYTEQLQQGLAVWRSCLDRQNISLVYSCKLMIN